MQKDRAYYRGYRQGRRAYKKAAALKKAAGAENISFYERKAALRLVKSEKRRAAKQRPLFYHAVMALAVIAIGLCLVRYLELNSAVTYSAERVSELEETLQDLKSENDEAENTIELSVSLDETKYKAMTKLNMTYPPEDQVIYYSSPDISYVRQVTDP